MDYLLIIIAAICISVNFCIEKLYQLKIVKNKIHLFFYYMLHGLFTVILFLLINNFKLNYSPFSLLMAILFSLFVTTYSVLGMIAIKYGKLSIYTTFLTKLEGQRTN